MLDQGAVNAVLYKGASLLPSGIQSLTGKFDAGDSIDLVNAENQQVIAKGICQYNYRDLLRIKGHKSDEIQNILGFCLSKVIVHRDDMVVLNS